jgi:cation diffusion facilitator CzcD-associated flavoprotein CzcO
VTEPSAIIIGAGPAGLAVGACLARAKLSFTILEREAALGASWRGHYDRLHLHTNKGTSGLPFIPFPRAYPRYPSRDQVVAYLEAYAGAFHLEPRFGEVVTAARRRDDRWEVETRNSTYVARHLVVATGLNREPITPRWEQQDAYRGRIMHSRDYRNGAEFRGARVLVVGIGNSGAEIALDLHEHGALPTIAVRGPVNVLPREILGVPIVAAGRLTGLLPPRVADKINAPLLRLVLGDLQPFGLSRPPYGPLTQIATTGRTPLIDVGTIGAIKMGKISIRPGIERFAEDGVVFIGGRREPFDAIVLATGYRTGLASILKIDGALDEQGNPQSNALPEGLHLCGFTTTAKGILHQIAREAPRIAARIASRPE